MNKMEGDGSTKLEIYFNPSQDELFRNLGFDLCMDEGVVGWGWG